MLIKLNLNYSSWHIYCKSIGISILVTDNIFPHSPLSQLRGLK